MHEDFAQRRRVAIAVAITVILVPAAFLLNRSDDTTATEPVGTLVGAPVIPGQVDGTGDADSRSDRPDGTDPMGTTPSEYIDGTVPPQANDPATIAIPRAGQSIRGVASFSHSITDTAACQIRDTATIPFASTITVRNLDNSQSVRCIVSVGGVQPDEDVILNADAFLQIGDLTDAPLSVEISW
jgi:hypothetical protein